MHFSNLKSKQNEHSLGYPSTLLLFFIITSRDEPTRRNGVPSVWLLSNSDTAVSNNFSILPFVNVTYFVQSGLLLMETQAENCFFEKKAWIILVIIRQELLLEISEKVLAWPHDCQKVNETRDLKVAAHWQNQSSQTLRNTFLNSSLKYFKKEQKLIQT